MQRLPSHDWTCPKVRSCARICEDVAEQEVEQHATAALGSLGISKTQASHVAAICTGLAGEPSHAGKGGGFERGGPAASGGRGTFQPHATCLPNAHSPSDVRSDTDGQQPPRGATQLLPEFCATRFNSATDEPRPIMKRAPGRVLWSAKALAHGPRDVEACPKLKGLRFSCLVRGDIWARRARLARYHTRTQFAEVAATALAGQDMLVKASADLKGQADKLKKIKDRRGAREHDTGAGGVAAAKRDRRPGYPCGVRLSVRQITAAERETSARPRGSV
eukprot:g2784.t1